MIARYARSPMAEIWTEQAKYERWLRVELAVVDALETMGRIPSEAAAAIRERARVDVEAAQRIEAEIGHDLLAFVRSLQEQVGEEGRFLHWGLTSYDVVDTGLSLALREACGVLEDALAQVQAVLWERAQAHRYTVMIGRTHGVHAEPITLGLKLLNWYDELARDLARLRHARTTVAVGKISGSVGTYAHIDPEVERRVCDRLGLAPAPIASQLLARDRHAEALQTLAVTAGTVERIAVEIRNLSRTEIAEVREGRPHGSSSMPHKRNPSHSETISGLARIVRTNALAALENMAVWHEQDLSRSSVERIILPDSFQALHTMLAKLRSVLRHLEADPERMRANISQTRGAVFSQSVLLALVEAGMGRTEAHELLHQAAEESARSGRHLHEVLQDKDRVTTHLSAEALARCFELDRHLAHVDTIFERFMPDGPGNAAD